MVDDVPKPSAAADWPGPRLHSSADRQRLAAGPTKRALAAFGVDERRVSKLPGGQGQAWSDGRVVLKSTGFEPERRWICDVSERWTAHDVVRVPEPIAARSGAARGTESSGWIVDGWFAYVFVPGRDAELLDEVERVREASNLFHEAVAGLDRPDWMDDRDDPWAYGDRLAWDGAAPMGTGLVRSLTDRLLAALKPVRSPNQMVHGDVLPNVLLDGPRPPAVIDWSPYHRPAQFANAIAVTDAVTFRGAPLALLDEWASGPDWSQLLIRAVLYRLGPTGFFTTRNSLMGSLVTHAERAAPVVDHLLTDGA